MAITATSCSSIAPLHACLLEVFCCAYQPSSHRLPLPVLQSGDWTVTIEGRCRVRVNGVHLSRGPREVYEASVEQLDYFATVPGVPGNKTASGAAGGAASGAASIKEQEELTQQLLRVRTRPASLGLLLGDWFVYHVHTMSACLGAVDSSLASSHEAARQVDR